MISVFKPTFGTKIYFKISHLIKRLSFVGSACACVIYFAALASEIDQQSALRLRRTAAPA